MKRSHDVPEPVAGSILQEWLSGNVWQSKPIENRDRSLRCCLIQQWEIRDKRSAIADAILPIWGREIPRRQIRPT